MKKIWDWLASTQQKKATKDFDDKMNTVKQNTSRLNDLLKQMQESNDASRSGTSNRIS